jgi:TP901 family phage tail tape measure protein
VAAKNEVKIVITGDTKGLGAAVGTAEKQLGGLSGKLSKAGASMTKIGQGLTTKVTLPIVGLGAMAVKTFADFDSAMTNSLSIQEGVSADMRKRMETTAREIAKTTTFSAKEAAEGYYLLASAGLSAEQQIAALPQVARFAAAGNFDLARATDLATDAQSALGLSVKDPDQNLKNLTRTTDVFSRASQLANASIEQFAIAMTNKAGTALRNSNKSIEEGTAVLALFADQGIKAEAAGTMLATTLSDLPKAAVTNADEFRRLGVEVFDSSGNLRNMADIADSFTAALGPMSDEQRTAALQAMGLNKQVADSIRTMIGGGDAIRRYQQELEGAGGATQRVADKQLQSFTAKLKILRSQFEDVAITVAPLIIDNFITPVVGGLEKLAGWLGKLTPTQQKWAVGLAAAAAAAGPLLLIVGKFVTTAVALSTALKGATAAQAGLNAAQATGKATMLANPIFLAVAAIAALGAAAVIAYRRFEGFRNVVDSVGRFLRDRVWPVLQDLGRFLAGAFVSAVRRVGTFVTKSLWPALQRVGAVVASVVVPALQRLGSFIANTVIPSVKVFIGVIGDAAAWLREHVGPVVTELGALVAAVWGRISQATRTAWAGISTVVRAAWAVISAVIRVAWPPIQSIIETGLATLSAAWSAAWAVISKVLPPVWAAIRTIVAAGLQFIRGVIRTVTWIISGDWSKAWDGIKRVASSIWEGIKGLVGRAIDSVKSTIGRVTTAISSVWTFVWTGIKNKVGEIFDGVKRTISDALDAAKRKVSDVLASIGNLFGGVKKTITRALSGLANTVGAPFKAAAQAIRDAWNNTIGGKGIKIPDLIPGIGGTSFTIPRLHTGIARVPGAPGSERLAILQAGESVRSRRQEDTLQDILGGYRDAALHANANPPAAAAVVVNVTVDARGSILTHDMERKVAELVDVGVAKGVRMPHLQRRLAGAR